MGDSGIQRRALSHDELDRILAEHTQWLESAGQRGTKADLTRTDLTGRDLRFARLAQAELSEASLSGALLCRADLRGANLRGAVGLTAEQLAGADLSGSHLPEGVARFEGTAYLRDASRSTQTLFLTCVTACLYSVLTIITTRDSGLVTNSPTSSLPIIQAAVPIVMFFCAGPLLLLAAHAALLLALHRQWKTGLRLPARFPDASSADQRADVFPIQAVPFRRSLPAFGNPSSEPRLRYVGPAIALWAIVPVTLLLFWARYLPRHDWPVTVVQVVALAVSLGMVAASAQHAWRSVAASATGRFEGTGLDRPTWVWLWLPAVIVVLGLASFGVLSEGAIEGTPHHVQLILPTEVESTRGPGKSGSGNPTSDEAKIACETIRSTNLFILGKRWLRCSAFEVRVRAGWVGGTVSDGLTSGRYKWIPLSLDMLGVTSYASLEEEEMSTRPTPWRFPGAITVRPKEALAIGEFGVLRAANLKGRDLRNANLKGAFLAEARIRGANLGQASLVEAKLQGADLETCRLDWADLSDADLRSANLTRAQLTGARLANADLRGAKLQDAVAHKAQMNDAKLDGADLTGMLAGEAILTSARLVGVSGEASDLKMADLSGAQLIGAKLFGAQMSSANLTETNLMCADLRKADFRNATLDKTNFHLALIDDAKFDLTIAVDAALPAACRTVAGRTQGSADCAAYARELMCACITDGIRDRDTVDAQLIAKAVADCPSTLGTKASR